MVLQQSSARMLSQTHHTAPIQAFKFQLFEQPPTAASAVTPMKDFLQLQPGWGESFSARVSPVELVSRSPLAHMTVAMVSCPTAEKRMGVLPLQAGTFCLVTRGLSPGVLCTWMQSTSPIGGCHWYTGVALCTELSPGVGT
jgi:hypothetical protein